MYTSVEVWYANTPSPPPDRFISPVSTVAVPELNVNIPELEVLSSTTEVPAGITSPVVFSHFMTPSFKLSNCPPDPVSTSLSVMKKFVPAAISTNATKDRLSAPSAFKPVNAMSPAASLGAGSNTEDSCPFQSR